MIKNNILQFPTTEYAKRYRELEESELVICVSCKEDIEGVTRNDLANYPYYINGVGALDPSCYNEIYAPKRLKQRRNN